MRLSALAALCRDREQELRREVYGDGKRIGTECGKGMLVKERCDSDLTFEKRMFRLFLCPR
jgi:hypothetical protein